MRRALVYAGLAAALVVACGGGDAGPDAAPDACAGSTDCGGPCAPGNDFGVGMACTAGGGECADTPGRMAPFCTVDQRPDADAFCTRPCDPTMPAEPQCGQGAVCENEGGAGPSGCILAACVGG